MVKIYDEDNEVVAEDISLRLVIKHAQENGVDIIKLEKTESQFWYIVCTLTVFYDNGDWTKVTFAWIDKAREFVTGKIPNWGEAKAAFKGATFNDCGDWKTL